jgi:hypothetical protein
MLFAMVHSLVPGMILSGCGLRACGGRKRCDKHKGGDESFHVLSP